MRKNHCTATPLTQPNAFDKCIPLVKQSYGHRVHIHVGTLVVDNEILTPHIAFCLTYMCKKHINW